ncbi:hypothetical protein Rsub_01239 [Raphidocelis subcapitata]|uniref:Uncharacterized protein n=1 Tax=Raphidocelis subcapitata TaxID=307507 RepID=A0A2V0NM39_9CHLO|nr:hypothetical protein Rsub_01239 [Raphidocelis subcapitata]|eukprot:GBF88524.1 hypothetical protein Rsub_01239 [Raphidocelis subcapitata]
MLASRPHGCSRRAAGACGTRFSAGQQLQHCGRQRGISAPAAAPRPACRTARVAVGAGALPPHLAAGGAGPTASADAAAAGFGPAARRFAAAALATGLLLLQPGGGAAAAGLFGGSDEGAPEPFTLYGSNFKLYSIEKLDGEKVVSRTRGFTVDTCISAVDEAAETPEARGQPTGERVRSGNNLLCKRSTGQDLKAACSTSCREACNAALDAEASKQQADTGLTLSPTDRKRLLRSCVRQCDYGCVGSGKTHDFVTPSRR